MLFILDIEGQLIANTAYINDFKGHIHTIMN